MSGDLSICTATRSPGSTPSATSALAARPERSNKRAIGQRQAVRRFHRHLVEVGRRGADEIEKIGGHQDSALPLVGASARAFARHGARELAHGRGSDDFVLVGEGLVVLFDIVEIVEIIDHQPMRLAQRRLGEIAERIEPFEPRAIAEVKARDGIDNAAGGGARMHEIMRGERQRARAAAPPSRPSCSPSSACRATPARGAPARRWPANFHPRARARSQAAKPGAGDKRHEIVQPRQFALQFLDHLLDQEIAETDARQGRAAHWRSNRTPPSSPPAAASSVRSEASSGAIAAGMASVSATSTKISGSSPSAG